MSADITDILREWEFDSDNQIRIIQAEDGRQVLQVRQPMGIEQYELDGRPDGKKPFGRESALEEFQARLESYRASHGSEEGFTLTHDDFAALQGEGVLFYFRYLVLFQIGDFVRTAGTPSTTSTSSPWWRSSSTATRTARSCCSTSPTSCG